MVSDVNLHPYVALGRVNQGTIKKGQNIKVGRCKLTLA